MNVVTIVFASLVCLGLCVPAFAGSFEGVVTMKDTSDDGTTRQKTYFKGDKMRVDEREGDYMVWDAAKKEGFMVDSKKRTVAGREARRNREDVRGHDRDQDRQERQGGGLSLRDLSLEKPGR